MVWAAFRVTIFGVAFLFGALIASLWNPLIGHQSKTEAAELSGGKGTSLLVSCVQGSPVVQQIRGSSGAIEVKCATSDMQVVESKPVPRREPRRTSSSPIAALISNTFLRNPE